ncbi:hypothetical protein VCHENC02_1076B, partial [Vibrio harveyi]
IESLTEPCAFPTELNQTFRNEASAAKEKNQPHNTTTENRYVTLF